MASRPGSTTSPPAIRMCGTSISTCSRWVGDRLYERHTEKAPAPEDEAADASRCSPVSPCRQETRADRAAVLSGAMSLPSPISVQLYSLRERPRKGSAR